MQRRLLFILLFLLPASCPFAQSLVEVKGSGLYLYGEGKGETIDEADQAALARLISQISVEVKSSVLLTEDERTSGNAEEAGTYYNRKIETYSQATLPFTEQLVLSNEPDAHVVRYIRKSEINRVFDGRRAKVKELVRLAQRGEKNCKIDEALRNYYWAFSLLKSLPHANELTYSLEDGTECHLLAWLPERINDVFAGLKATVAARDGQILTLAFTYRGSPVASLDYTYFDGRSWSNIYSARDGRGTLEMVPGAVADNVQIKYEYAYRGEAHIDREVEAVLKVVKGRAMRKAYASLSGSAAQPAASPQAQAALQAVQTAGVKTNLTAVADDTPYRRTLETVLEAIRTRRFDSALPCFTSDGADMYRRLITYGNARLVGQPQVRFYKYRDQVVARTVPMSFSFKSGMRKSFVENIVFTFNGQGKIDCLAFALDDKAAADIMQKNVWPETARLALMEFMENYKTAFALERWDYINTLFSDDAVIIIGHICKKLERVDKGDGLPEYRNNEYVRRNRLSKQEYMRNLRRCFDSNEFINIRFGDNEVVRSGRADAEYGIQIKQDYYSSSYGDTGYLFLKVNLNDPDEPVIKVRTWQPKPDPIDGLYNLGNF